MNEWIGQVLPFWKDLTETEKQMLLTHTALEEYEKGVLLHIDGGGLRRCTDCKGRAGPCLYYVTERWRDYIVSSGGREMSVS